MRVFPAVKEPSSPIARARTPMLPALGFGVLVALSAAGVRGLLTISFDELLPVTVVLFAITCRALGEPRRRAAFALAMIALAPLLVPSRLAPGLPSLISDEGARQADFGDRAAIFARCFVDGGRLGAGVIVGVVAWLVTRRARAWRGIRLLGAGAVNLALGAAGVLIALWVMRPTVNGYLRSLPVTARILPADATPRLAQTEQRNWEVYPDQLVGDLLIGRECNDSPDGYCVIRLGTPLYTWVHTRQAPIVLREDARFGLFYIDDGATLFPFRILGGSPADVTPALVTRATLAPFTAPAPGWIAAPLLALVLALIARRRSRGDAALLAALERATDGVADEGWIEFDDGRSPARLPEGFESVSGPVVVFDAPQAGLMSYRVAGMMPGGVLAGTRRGHLASARRRLLDGETFAIGTIVMALASVGPWIAILLGG